MAADRLATGTFALPPRHRQNERKPARCQKITVSGFTISEATLGAMLAKSYAQAQSI
jgi:hypothetical protein